MLNNLERWQNHLNYIYKKELKIVPFLFVYNLLYDRYTDGQKYVDEKGDFLVDDKNIIVEHKFENNFISIDALKSKFIDKDSGTISFIIL